MAFSHLHDRFNMVRHPQFEPEVRQAILASWACGAGAAEDQPALRQPPGSKLQVPCHDVVTKLHSLDAGS